MSKVSEGCRQKVALGLWLGRGDDHYRHGVETPGIKFGMAEIRAGTASGTSTGFDYAVFPLADRGLRLRVRIDIDTPAAKARGIFNPQPCFESESRLADPRSDCIGQGGAGVG